MNKRDLRAHSHFHSQSSVSSGPGSSPDSDTDPDTISGTYDGIVSGTISPNNNHMSTYDNIYSTQLVKVKAISTLFTYNFYIDAKVFINIIKNPRTPYILLTNFKERIMCTFMNDNYTNFNISDDDEILQNTNNITDNLYCISLRKKNYYIYSPYAVFIILAAMCILYSCIISQENRQRRVLIRSMN